MAKTTAAMVKQLREMTGAGMMECKKALDEADGDITEAVDVLRRAGEASAVKKADRATNEGTILALVSDDAAKAALVELDCETDFVGENAKFAGYARRIAQTIIDQNPADVDALRALKEENGDTIDALLIEAIHTLGENIKLPRFARMETSHGAIASYIHGAGKIGVLVQFDLADPQVAAKDEFKQYGRNIAMQVAAAAPVAVTRDEVDPAIVEHEMGIYKAQAADSGKPEAIQEKIATGRMEKFYRGSVLNEQEYVKDSDQTISQYTKATADALGSAIKIVAIKRFLLGE
ncbi:MAG: translation elongation factor Ts [Eggerthellaceae bacterium]|jgi:elongation factor Ts|nr:translation elongation factor Ts [Eggerthellaceae bacterium]MCH4221065.1 translation elongation factor Ts [Eggerthellaceae bacterium]